MTGARPRNLVAWLDTHRGDFDGDGRDGVFVYNRSTGTWFNCLRQFLLPSTRESMLQACSKALT
ncbi:MAG: hypothetical protein ACE148_06940 [Vicinamibacterales bacterium]